MTYLVQKHADALDSRAVVEIESDTVMCRCTGEDADFRARLIADALNAYGRQEP